MGNNCKVYKNKIKGDSLILKIAFVVQRYGAEIIGGAEYFTRLIAEKMQKHYEIEILTTCAVDYHNWENKYLEGIDHLNGVLIHRFKNDRNRDLREHIIVQNRVFSSSNNTMQDEIEWLESQGPYCPDLINYIVEHKNDYVFFVFFTFRYYPTFYGVQQVPNKSLIVPFAENDEAVNLSITNKIFNNVRGIIYCTQEESRLINRNIVLDDKVIRSDIIGCGIDLPTMIEKNSIKGNYFLYLGRIEGSKGCYELFDYYLRLVNSNPEIPSLFLAGLDAITIPQHPKIKYLGFINDAQKYSLLKKAQCLIMPSAYESFSLVTLESMACGTPVLVNGACEVLKGHCLRSNAGLWYQNYDEFKECIDFLLNNPLTLNMSSNAIDYIQNNYSWNIVEQKYLQMFRIFNH